MDQALEYLRKSLELAKKGGYIRVYIDLGDEMETLFHNYKPAQDKKEYISLILSGFSREKKQHNVIKEYKNPNKESNLGLVIKPKEVEMLRLISQGFQNKEIAEQLYLATDSIKKSLYRLYQKLDVNNRISAVSKALEMGLIEQYTIKD